MSQIVPFGIYEGKKISVLLKDKNYVKWLKKQKWLKSRYEMIYHYIHTDDIDYTDMYYRSLCSFK